MKKVSKKLNNLDSKAEVIKIEVVPKQKKTNRKFFNEAGERVTASGKPFSMKGIEALKKYREQREKNKIQPQPIFEKKENEEEEEESEEEETNEYEIEEIAIKKPDPKIVEKEVIKEVLKPDPKVVSENQLLKERNKKLEESFSINQHLMRISHLAKATVIRF